MTSAVVELPRFINCCDIYEEAVLLFAQNDKDLDRVLHVTRPEIVAKVVVLSEGTENEEYFVEATLDFPDEKITLDLLDARRIMEDKFRQIKNIIDLEERLNRMSAE